MNNDQLRKALIEVQIARLEIVLSVLKQLPAPDTSTNIAITQLTTVIAELYLEVGS